MHRHTLYACIYPTTHKTAKKVGTGGGGLHKYICLYGLCSSCVKITRLILPLDLATLVAQDTLPSQRKAHLNFRATLVSQLSELVHELL